MTPSPFALMRKHPKKSTFFVTTSLTSLWLFYDYTLTRNLHQHACKKAAQMGDMKLQNFASQPRHLTVILNPVAGKRKSKKLYTRWVEPILHLSGIKVSLVETESPSQAYELMKIMSNCDGVAIVGGDGTVHEALNGLLHRPDSVKAAQDFPIGIMPTGTNNSIARLIHQGLDYRNQKELLIHSTLKLVNQTSEKFDVLKVVPIEKDQTETTAEKDLPIYALRDIKYGKYQDNFIRISGFPFYQSYIKPYWLRLRKIFKKDFTVPQIESIAYTDPCIGCSRCIERHKLKCEQMYQAPEPSANRRWWSMLAPTTKTEPSADEKRELELAKRDNPTCDKWKRINDLADVSDIRACMVGGKTIRLSIGRGGEYTPSESLEVQDIELKLAENLNEDEKFLIDGQPNQARSIKVSTLGKVVTIYTSL